jgi:RHS repeat-associated protein
MWQNGTLPKYSFNAKELDEETGMYYYEARYYKPPVFTSRDPMFEKYFWMTPYAYCANNPVKYVDPSGEFPVWAVVGAALEYGFQVYDNYNDGKTGYDAWVNNIDFTDVLVSAINPSGKYKVAGIMLEEAFIAAFDISINEGVKINRDVKDVAKKTVVNTVVSVEMGKVTKASSETALQNANKEVNTASENLNRAKHKAQRSPNSVKKAENVRTAQYNVQYARNKQVRTQMMYYTVGQAPNATEYGVSALIKKSLEDKKATQQQVP